MSYDLVECGSLSDGFRCRLVMFLLCNSGLGLFGMNAWFNGFALILIVWVRTGARACLGGFCITYIICSYFPNPLLPRWGRGEDGSPCRTSGEV